MSELKTLKVRLADAPQDVPAVVGEAVETIERVIRAHFGPGWLADGLENTSSMRCARAVAEALAS